MTGACRGKVGDCVMPEAGFKPEDVRAQIADQRVVAHAADQ
jgi:hypothetical protein